MVTGTTLCVHTQNEVIHLVQRPRHCLAAAVHLEHTINTELSHLALCWKVRINLSKYTRTAGHQQTTLITSIFCWINKQQWLQPTYNITNLLEIQKVKEENSAAESVLVWTVVHSGNGNDQLLRKRANFNPSSL